MKQERHLENHERYHLTVPYICDTQCISNTICVANDWDPGSGELTQLQLLISLIVASLANNCDINTVANTSGVRRRI